MDQYQSQFAYMAPPPPPAFMSTPPTQYLAPPYASQPFVQPPPPAVLPCTSIIGADSPSPCYIYRQDERGGLVDQMCQQICLPDGRIFVEHVPNHCVIYAPLGYGLAQTLERFQQMNNHSMMLGASLVPAVASRPKARSHSAKQQAAKAKPAHDRHQSAGVNSPASSVAAAPASSLCETASLADSAPAAAANHTQAAASAPVKKVKEKSAKPINAFIKYRSFKIAELKRLHPEVSQTEISRLAGECWKTESEDIKNQFRIQYMEEKKIYDLKKASSASSSKRSRSGDDDSSDTESLPATVVDIGIGIGIGGAPAGFDPTARRRSLTLPASDPTACTRAASASPMLAAAGKPPASKRRRCVTEDMRKQLATKSLDMSSYYGPFSFEDMTPMLAPLPLPPLIDTSMAAAAAAAAVAAAASVTNTASTSANTTPLDLYSAADFAASISTFMSTTASSSDSQN
ncbi:hypothetical protein H4S06_000197 [Coemansia sp. BCRC 34490]|nr:hypothetical protein H4S06_000197 [Coemansia sp. BCRC 34490]